MLVFCLHLRFKGCDLLLLIGIIFLRRKRGSNRKRKKNCNDSGHRVGPSNRSAVVMFPYPLSGKSHFRLQHACQSGKSNSSGVTGVFSGGRQACTRE